MKAHHSLAFAFFAVLVGASCGGKAIIDGAGGATSSASSTGMTTGTATSTSTGTATGTATSTSTGPAVVSVSATSVSSSSGQGMTCDVGDCGECINSECAYGKCMSQFDACMNSSECANFLTCVEQCQDEQCADKCVSQHPEGFELYISVIECAICTPDACFLDCGGEFQCD